MAVSNGALVTRASVDGVLNGLTAESARENTAVGTGALPAPEAKAEGNCTVGAQAGASLTTGQFNTAVGVGSLTANKTGNGNTTLGYFAGQLLTGGSNTALGVNAMEQAAAVSNSVAVGANSLAHAEANGNVAVGANAGLLAKGEGNVFIGNSAGSAETGAEKLYIANQGNAAHTLISGDFSVGELKLAPTGGKVGFYGVAPVARAAHPATLAEVITLLTNVGLCS